MARTAQAVELPECLGVDAVEVQAVHVGDPAVGVKLLEVGRVHPGPGRIGELADRVHVHVAKKRPLLVRLGEGALLRVEHEEPRSIAEATDSDDRPVLDRERPRLPLPGKTGVRTVLLAKNLVAEPVERREPLPDVRPHRLAISREGDVTDEAVEHFTRLLVRVEGHDVGRPDRGPGLVQHVERSEPPIVRAVHVTEVNLHRRRDTRRVATGGQQRVEHPTLHTHGVGDHHRRTHPGRQVGDTRVLLAGSGQAGVDLVHRELAPPVGDGAARAVGEHRRTRIVVQVGQHPVACQGGS